MSNWNEKLNQMTQSAISKSKEVAGITKLNLENSSRNQDIKIIYAKVGEYVLENNLLSEDAVIAEWVVQVNELKAEIKANNEKINLLKNVNICPNCGNAMPRTSKFCDQCGTEIAGKTQEAEDTDVKEAEEVIVDTADSVKEDDTTTAEG